MLFNVFVRSMIAEVFGTGQFVVSTIGDFVWLDANHNGFQDVGEIGVSGVSGELYDAPAGVRGPLLKTTTTDSTGHYQFSDFPLGEFLQIRFVNPNPGSLGLTWHEYFDLTNSDPNPETGWVEAFAVQTGDSVNTIDARFYQSSTTFTLAVWLETTSEPVIVSQNNVDTTYAAVIPENQIEGEDLIVHRDGNLSQGLTVHLGYSGAANIDYDYYLTRNDVLVDASTLTFAPGENRISLKVVPVNDHTPEPDENAVIGVATGIGYLPGNPGAKAFLIVANIAPTKITVNEVKKRSDGIATGLQLGRWGAFFWPVTFTLEQKSHEKNGGLILQHVNSCCEPSRGFGNAANSSVVISLFAIADILAPSLLCHCDPFL